MKEQIIDNLARGVVLASVAWFGLRGILPEVNAAGNMPALLLALSGAIGAYAVGPTAYRAYRCARRCEATCDPSFCRA